MKAINCLLLICLLWIPVVSNNRGDENDYQVVELRELGANPGRYLDRRVEFTAEVVSVNANRQSMDVFDARSKTVISVSMRALSRTERQNLVMAPIFRVSVFGRVVKKGDRFMIESDKVLALAPNLMAAR